MQKICIFDNYDSFTYNLHHLLAGVRKKADFIIVRNKNRQVLDVDFDALIISPGPMGPVQTGCLRELFEKRIIPGRIPTLGICLGMQFLGHYFHGRVTESAHPVHGRVVTVQHQGEDLFKGIKKKMRVMRYNSLEVRDPDPGKIRVLAREVGSGMIMALRHRDLPFAGVQFHPESFLTRYSRTLIRNFFTLYVED
jgi:anthranilate synthase/aminodeoxychorismate synthase-like glutamine amidotransferase